MAEWMDCLIDRGLSSPKVVADVVYSGGSKSAA